MDKVTTHRLFYALKPDPVVRDALVRTIDSLSKRQTTRLRWVPVENWHVTLKFIGAVSSNRIDDLCDCLHRAALESPPVEIRLNSIEPFPSSNRPIVLAATGAGSAAAEHLVQELESCCSEAGWPEDTRGWRCHLTLARVRNRGALSFEPVDIDVAFTASEILLLESTSGDAGTRYVPLATAALAGLEK